MTCIRLFILHILLLISPVGLAAYSESEPSALVVALKPDKDPDRMLAERKALSHYLANKLKRPVTVIVPLSSAVIHEGLANGTIDLAFISSTGAVQADKQGIGTVLLAVSLDGKPYYLSYWVALKDKSYNSVESLKGRPIAFSSRTSTSGFLIPAWDLYKRDLLTPEAGPEGYFGKGHVFYGVGYVSAVQRVLSGQVEAAAVSYYVLDQDRHLSARERARLKRVTSQGPVPTHTLVVRSSLAAAQREPLKQVFLAMNKDNPDLRDKVFQDKLIEVDPDEHLKSTREALALIEKMHY